MRVAISLAAELKSDWREDKRVFGRPAQNALVKVAANEGLNNR